MTCAASTPPPSLSDTCVEVLGNLSGTELTGTWASGCDSANRNGSYARYY